MGEGQSSSRQNNFALLQRVFTQTSVYLECLPNLTFKIFQNQLKYLIFNYTY